MKIADNKLYERIKATFDALISMGKIPKKSHGDGSPQRFSDEVAGQLYSNNTRFWSFQEHLPRKVNTTRSSQSFFGWYAMQGKSLLTELKGGKVADIQQALLAIKEANNEYDCMVIFWDNAKTHKALETWGWERQIYFIPIPSYSTYRDWETDRKSTRLNSSHLKLSRMPSSA